MIGMALLECLLSAWLGTRRDRTHLARLIYRHQDFRLPRTAYTSITVQERHLQPVTLADLGSTVA